MINYPIIEWTFYNATIKNKKLFIFSEKNKINKNLLTKGGTKHFYF